MIENIFTYFLNLRS